MRHCGEKFIFDAVSPFSISARRLRTLQKKPPFFLKSLAVSDVADVALNNMMAVFFIDVANKLHFAELSVGGLQRQILITEIACYLQLSKCILTRLLIAEQTDFPKLLSQKFIA